MNENNAIHLFEDQAIRKHLLGGSAYIVNSACTEENRTNQTYTLTAGDVSGEVEAG